MTVQRVSPGGPMQVPVLKYAMHLLILMLTAGIVPAHAQEVALFDTPGDATFVVPDGVTSVTVEAWGAGGAGGAVTARGASGGGGGGAYARAGLDVSAGDQLTIRVGAGGTFQSDAGDSAVRQSGQVVARAEAGANVAANEADGGRGGRAAQSVGNEARYSGGDGADGIIRGFFGRLQGGGGGSSAGTGASGENGDEDTGGSAPGGGGNGGDGSDTAGISSSGGSPGGRPGGGGGGATTRSFFGGDFAGGNGADGQVRIVWTTSGDDGGGDVGCAASFPDGISSYNGGEISFGYNAQLIGSPDGLLEAGNISRNNGSNLGTCGSNDCVADDGAALPLDLPDFPPINAPSGTNLYLGFREARTVGTSGNRFSTIGTNTRAELTFSGNHDTYYIGALNLGFSTRVFLQPGDYYIDSISVSSQVDIQVLGSGTARLFVRGDVNLGSPSYLNSPGVDQAGDTSRLLLASYGNVSLNNNATVSGAVFAVGDINLGSASYLYGGATASNIALGTNSKLYFESGGMADLDFGGACGDQDVTVDHFRIYHPEAALTCTPAQGITVQACVNEDCSELYEEGVSVELSPSGGWIPGRTVGFTGESPPLALRSTAPGSVLLGIDAASVDASGSPPVRCFPTGGTVQSDCEISYAEAGFLLSIPDHISGQTVQASLEAVKADPNDPQQCTPGFTGNREINFSQDYINPASGTLAVENDDGSLVASAVELTFDMNGVATLPLRYRDVGEVAVTAQYTGSGDDAGLDMRGTDSFIARPERFVIAVPGNPGNAGVTDANVFAVAGEAFEVEVRALNTLGDLTPNFGQELQPESVALIARQADGVVELDIPDLEGAFDPFGASCDTPQPGKACGQFSWPEVGIIAVEPSLADEPGDGYLGAGGSVDGVILSYLGRFIPDHFTIESDDPGSLNMTCDSGSFTYSGQPTGWAVRPSVRVVPRNATDSAGVTRNYLVGDFMRLEPGGVSREWPETDAQQTLSDGATGYPVDIYHSLNGGVPENGVLQVEQRSGEDTLIYRFAESDEIVFEKSTASQVIPFEPELTLMMTGIVDQDSVEDNRDDDDPFEINTFAESNGRIFYGRLIAEDVYGPVDVEELEMGFLTEYWSESDTFELNDVDSCTTWDTGHIENPEQYHDMTVDSGQFDEGQGGPLKLQGKGVQGYDTLTWEKLWWHHDFDGDGELEAPSATASFGVYLGHDRIIFWREVIN